MGKINFKDFTRIAQENVDKSRFTMKLYRFISKYISYLFIYLKISPNQVTIFHNIMEFFALFLFLSGQYKLYYLAIILLILGGILDNVDGEIARFTKNTSLKGEYLDLIGHRIIHPLFFLFLSIGIYNTNSNYYYLIYGAIAAVGYTISEIATNVYKQILFDKNQSKQMGLIPKKKHKLFSPRWWEYTLFCFDHIKLLLAILLYFNEPHLLLIIYAPLFFIRAIMAVLIKYRLFIN